MSITPGPWEWAGDDVENVEPEEGGDEKAKE